MISNSLECAESLFGGFLGILDLLPLLVVDTFVLLLVSAVDLACHDASLLLVHLLLFVVQLGQLLLQLCTLQLFLLVLFFSGMRPPFPLFLLGQ